ncbi:MAG: hypothetical protein AAGB18_03320, partial [Pseudomonadota bacterium]
SWVSAPRGAPRWSQDTMFKNRFYMPPEIDIMRHGWPSQVPQAGRHRRSETTVTEIRKIFRRTK